MFKNLSCPFVAVQISGVKAIRERNQHIPIRMALFSRGRQWARGKDKAHRSEGTCITHDLKNGGEI